MESDTMEIEERSESPSPDISPDVSLEPKKNVSKVKPEETNDTIFIKNLSFDTNEDGLKSFIEENFGETIYCLVCRDKETDESRGTGFARFKEPGNAAKCLEEWKDREQQTKFHLDGRNLIVLPAISREKVGDLTKKVDRKTDKRNLALAYEGYIKPSSDEAQELSKGDLERRRVLNARKKELLKNLHNFVSDTRLCIHNLPPSVDDKKLRRIFLDSIKSTNPGAKLLECKVMRNKKGSGQLGASKGFGFVAFSKHEHSLAALRAINNNPKTFSREKRPIVEFSIENLVALNKKKTRLANSQRKLKALQDPKESAKQAKKMKKRPSVAVKSDISKESGKPSEVVKKIKKKKKNNTENKKMKKKKAIKSKK